MGHELGGVRKVAVTNVTGEKGVSQDALLILCRVARLQVALFALMIAEDYVALDALQGELGGYGNQIGGVACNLLMCCENTNKYMEDDKRLQE